MSGRFGITYTRWQRWRIKRMYDAGKLVQAQRYILRIIEARQ